MLAFVLEKLHGNVNPLLILKKLELERYFKSDMKSKEIYQNRVSSFEQKDFKFDLFTNAYSFNITSLLLKNTQI